MKFPQITLPLLLTGICPFGLFSEEAPSSWCSENESVIDCAESCVFSEIDPSSYLDFETGWRLDRINESVKIIDSTLVIPTGSLENQFTRISIWQVGMRGWGRVGDWFLKGSGYYGWVIDGDYNIDYGVKGDLRGYTVDALVGLGHLFSIKNCFALAPVVGFSYDKQHLPVRNVISGFDPAVFSLGFQKGTFNAAFFGPWIGLDFIFTTPCDFSFNAGYEFHYGWARDRWHQAANPANQGFSYHTHLDDMRGNVFHLEAEYNLPCNWQIGLLLQYLFWNNAHSDRSSIPSPSVTGLTPTQHQNTFDLNWRSFWVLFNIGHKF